MSNVSLTNEQHLSVGTLPKPFEPIEITRQNEMREFKMDLDSLPIYHCYNGDQPTGIMCRVRAINGDGNCLFRSLSYILSGTEENYSLIRRAIVSLIETYEDNDQHLFDGKTPQQYLKDMEMEKDGIWGTEVEISIAAFLFKVNIYTLTEINEQMVWQHSKPSVFNRNDNLNNDENYPGVYLYNENRNHYDVILPLGDSDADAVVEDLQNILEWGSQAIHAAAKKKPKNETNADADGEGHESDRLIKNETKADANGELPKDKAEDSNVTPSMSSRNIKGDHSTQEETENSYQDSTLSLFLMALITPITMALSAPMFLSTNVPILINAADYIKEGVMTFATVLGILGIITALCITQKDSTTAFPRDNSENYVCVCILFVILVIPVVLFSTIRLVNSILLIDRCNSYKYLIFICSSIFLTLFFISQTCFILKFLKFDEVKIKSRKIKHVVMSLASSANIIVWSYATLSHSFIENGTDDFISYCTINSTVHKTTFAKEFHYDWKPRCLPIIAEGAFVMLCYLLKIWLYQSKTTNQIGDPHSNVQGSSNNKLVNAFSKISIILILVFILIHIILECVSGALGIAMKDCAVHSIVILWSVLGCCFLKESEISEKVNTKMEIIDIDELFLIIGFLSMTLKRCLRFDLALISAIDEFDTATSVVEAIYNAISVIAVLLQTFLIIFYRRIISLQNDDWKIMLKKAIFPSLALLNMTFWITDSFAHPKDHILENYKNDFEFWQVTMQVLNPSALLYRIHFAKTCLFLSLK